MVRRIVWSKRAQNDRIEILRYWKNRTQSNKYSRKLNRLFVTALNLIAQYPEIGRQTNDEEIRIKVVRDYLIIYEISTNEKIQVLTIWSSKQNPKRLKNLL